MGINSAAVPEPASIVSPDIYDTRSRINQEPELNFGPSPDLRMMDRAADFGSVRTSLNEVIPRARKNDLRRSLKGNKGPAELIESREGLQENNSVLRNSALP